MSIIDTNLDEEAPFDPGYSSSISRVSGNIEYLYSIFSSIPSLAQKRFQFSIIYPKIIEAVNLNVNFYLGCILWGVYLSSQKNVPIIGNPCLGLTFDDSCFQEVDFLLDFIKKGLNRDSKYYINKIYETDPKKVKILENYREFMKINKAFVKTKTTADIKIPSSIKKQSDKDLKQIYDTIYLAVKNDNLNELLPLADKLF